MAVINFTEWVVRSGESGPHVALAQCLLNKWAAEAGLDPIAEDGKAGPGTAGRIREFQQAENVIADGAIGPVGWRLLSRYSTVVSDPEPAPPSMMPPQMTIMCIDVDGSYSRHVRLFVAAARIFMRLVCVYWRCNFRVIAGSIEEFDPDRHVALLFGDGDGGVSNALGWHWHGPVQAVFQSLGINISDDDNDPIGWVDMTHPGSWQRTAFHELVEIIVNAFVNFLARNYSDPTYYWMLESADAVQNDSFLIRITEGEFAGEVVEATNFIGPNWAGNDGEFEPFGMASDVVGADALVRDFALGPYDVMGLLTGPWQVRGYQILVSQTNPNDVRFAFGAGMSIEDVPAHAARRIAERVLRR